MVYRIPRTPIALKDTHIWANYEPGLCETPFVRKYLQATLRKWVEDCRIHNPLVLPWVRQLLVNGSRSPPARLDQILGMLETTMGEGNVLSLVEDLLSKPVTAREVSTSIASFWGEVAAFERLRAMKVCRIRKLTEHGDWDADGVPVSVKTVFDMDHNHWTIQETLAGYACLAECPTLGQVSTIRLSRAEGLDDSFMNDILRFIANHLDRALEFLSLDLAFPDWYTACVEALSMPIPGLGRAGAAGRLRLSGMRGHQSEIILTLKDIREGPQAVSRSHKIEFTIEPGRDNSGVLRTSTHLDAWWGNPNLDQVNKERVEMKIRAHLDKIVKARRKNEAPRLAGWVNFGVHPSLQDGIACAPAGFREFLASLVCESDFPVIFCPYEVFQAAPLPFIVLFRDVDPGGIVVEDSTSPAFSDLVGGIAR